MSRLHWIGRNYYKTPRKFIKEAQIYGITRRVSLMVLAGMSWGDMVLCIQSQGRSKWGSVFLEFSISRLSGLSEAGQEAIGEKYKLVKVSEGGKEVGRGCGSYIEGPTYGIEGATLKDLALLLQELKNTDTDIGEPMVGCSSSGYHVLDLPWPILKGIPFRPGFRPFNRDAFVEIVEARRKERLGKSVIISDNQFYAESVVSGKNEGQTQVVFEYVKL